MKSVQSTTTGSGLAAEITRNYKELAIKLTQQIASFQRFLMLPDPPSDLTIKFKSYKLYEMKQSLQEMYAQIQYIESRLK